MNNWAEADRPLRLQEKALSKDDSGAKALACHSLLERWIGPQLVWEETIWLRFVEGNPNSTLSQHFLAWCSQKLQTAGKAVLVLIWDHASWHISRTTRAWIRQNNHQVKQNRQGVLI